MNFWKRLMVCIQSKKLGWVRPDDDEELKILLERALVENNQAKTEWLLEAAFTKFRGNFEFRGVAEQLTTSRGGVWRERLLKSAIAEKANKSLLSMLNIYDAEEVLKAILRGTGEAQAFWMNERQVFGKLVKKIRKNYAFKEERQIRQKIVIEKIKTASDGELLFFAIIRRCDKSMLQIEKIDIAIPKFSENCLIQMSKRWCSENEMLRAIELKKRACKTDVCDNVPMLINEIMYEKATAINELETTVRRLLDNKQLKQHVGIKAEESTTRRAAL